jgi:hypothetical protein
MKITLDFAANKISIEGDAPQLLEIIAAVREAVPSIEEIVITTNSTRAPHSGPGPGESLPRLPSPPRSGSNGKTLNGQTIRQFVRSLPLRTAQERIVAIAYYMKHQEGRDVFSPKEMDGWFSICALPKPSQMPVALSDAKRHAGYVDSAGYGKWKLTNNGENLVVGKLNVAGESDE